MQKPLYGNSWFAVRLLQFVKQFVDGPLEKVELQEYDSIDGPAR